VVILIHPLRISLAQNPSKQDLLIKKEYIHNISDNYKFYLDTKLKNYEILSTAIYDVKDEIVQINKLYDYLKTKNSIFKSLFFAQIIVTESNKVNADYRIVVGIMESESGFCEIPYKKYNCFGYLNKIQYSSFQEAFSNLTPKIASFVAKYGWDLIKLGKSYGAINYQEWADKVYKLAIKVPN